jgi:hypothetical protein
MSKYNWKVILALQSDASQIPGDQVHLGRGHYFAYHTSTHPASFQVDIVLGTIVLDKTLGSTFWQCSVFQKQLLQRLGIGFFSKCGGCGPSEEILTSKTFNQKKKKHF